MSNSIRLKRGNRAQIPTLNTGEPAFTVDDKSFFIGNSTGNVEFWDYTKLRGKYPYYTPEFFGAVGDGVADDSTALLNAMNYCATNGLTLHLNKKYRIAQAVNYVGSNPLLIIGSKGNYNSLLSDTSSFANEQSNILLDNGVTISIQGLGSTTWQCIGFSSTAKANSSTGLTIQSFHNKIINCSFAQMNNGVYFKNGATNWNGENQVLYSNFSKVSTCILSESECSDCEIIGNLFGGTCDVAFYGNSAGFSISLNHFYNKMKSTFQYFNTSIVNNYIQEIDGDVSLILDGSFGCKVNDNKFELNSSTDRPALKGLLGIKLNNGKGNINIDGNSVHGKDNTIVVNLAFIQLVWVGTKYDMPINIGVNNLRNCSYVFTENYALYNFRGSLTGKGLQVAYGGTVDPSTVVEVNNGICSVYAKLTSITSANVIKFSNLGFPSVCTCIVNRSGTITTDVKKIQDSGTWISYPDYASITSIEILSIYPISHGTQPILYP